MDTSPLPLTLLLLVENLPVNKLMLFSLPTMLSSLPQELSRLDLPIKKLPLILPRPLRNSKESVLFKVFSPIKLRNI